MSNKGRVDLNSVAGILLALAAILGGQMLEGGHISALMQFAAFFIVMGGTVGAVLLQSPVRILVNGVKMSKWVFYPPKKHSRLLIKQLVSWSYLARKEGLLMLEGYAESEADPLTKKGLQLLADGSKPEKLREILEIEVDAEVSRRSVSDREPDTPVVIAVFVPTRGPSPEVVGDLSAMIRVEPEVRVPFPGPLRGGPPAKGGVRQVFQ